MAAYGRMSRGENVEKAGNPPARRKKVVWKKQKKSRRATAREDVKSVIIYAGLEMEGL